MSNKVFGYHTERILELLDKGVIPWKRMFDPNVGLPRNGATGRYYNGSNIFMLSLAGFQSPYWYTKNQIRKLKGKIRPGEEKKDTMVVFWMKDEKINKTTGEKKKWWMLRYTRALNREQTTDLPKPKKMVQANPFEKIESAHQILTDSPMNSIIHWGYNQPAYYPTMDRIEMPKPESFETSESYYSTLFHEMGHSTGHETRLGRDLTGLFGDHGYSKEELIAEMTSVFLCGIAGIENTIENSAAYIDGWRRKITDDNRLVITAASKAEKAAKYILGTHL